MDETLKASHWGSDRRPPEKTSLNLYASASRPPPLGESFNVISSETTGKVLVIPSSYDTRTRTEMSKKGGDVARSSAATNESEEFVSFSSAIGSDFDFSATFSEVDGAPWSPPPMSSAEELFDNGRIRPLRQFPPAQLEPSNMVRPSLSRSDDGYFDFRSSANYATFSPPQSPPASSPRQVQRKLRYGDARPAIQTTTPALEEWKKSNEARRKSSEGNSMRMPAASETRRRTRESGVCRRTRSLSPLRVFHMDDQPVQIWEGNSLPSPISDACMQGAWRRRTLKELLDASDSGESPWQEQKGGKSAEKTCRGRRKKSKGRAKGAPSPIPSASSGKKTGAPPSPKNQALSPHARHYTSQRAHAEQMKKKTFLPYRHGLLGCLGFPSRSYRSVSGINSLSVKA